MIQVCDDCLDEFETDDESVTICEDCKQPYQPFDSADKTGNIWQLVRSRGFKSQSEVDYYQFVKSEHKRLSGKDLPKVDEKIKGK